MTYNEICAALRAAGIEEYRHEAALLLSHFCGISRDKLPFCRNESFDSPELERALEERRQRRPLQYILGEWQFCSERYIVGEGCLIPRPETETLVLLAAELLPKNSVFADLCTGSGCIAVSLLVRRPDCRAVALDLSADALRFARQNAELNGVSDRIEFINADLLDPSTPTLLGRSRFSAIISNPPYIPSRTVDELDPELFFEPRTALDGGEDGLTFYRALTNDYHSCLTRDGFMLFEAGYDQEKSLSELAEKKGFSFEALYDLSGHFRTAKFTPNWRSE